MSKRITKLMWVIINLLACVMGGMCSQMAFTTKHIGIGVFSIIGIIVCLLTLITQITELYDF